MGKFGPLTNYLNAKRENTISLSFSDIERIVSFELCPSARKHNAYWHLSDTHMLPRAIDDAGYRVDTVSLADECITLKRKT